jgi:hypothetical protein
VSGIKITPADEAFGKCIKERAEWTCERCGTKYPDGGPSIHVAHVIGRANKSVRYDPLNAFCLCYGCHSWFHANPLEFARWVYEKLGADLVDVLHEHENDIARGREARRSRKEIAQHYRAEHEKQLQKRAAGIRGRLPFEGY